MNRESQDRINNQIKSMFEVGYEFVGRNREEVNTIYIFCSTEESLFFTFFYNIKGQLKRRHEINSVLKNSCDVSFDSQMDSDEIGLENLEEILSIFKEQTQEIPKRIKAVFVPQTEKFSVNFEYEEKLINTGLTEEDVLSEWISSEVK